METRQRLIYLGIAAVIAVVAVIVLAGGGDGDRASSTPTATATPTSEATEPSSVETPTPTPTATPAPPLLTGGNVRELEFTEGDTVRFRVRSDKPEEVHVHGYNLMKDVAPGKTVTFSFKATIPGIFEVEFEDSGEQIAELKVEPR